MRFVLRAVALTVLGAWSVVAQPHVGASHGPSRDSLAVMATVLATIVAPAINGSTRREWLLTQPMLGVRGAHGAQGAVQYTTMLNFERWTMPSGEPVAGIWGEGFIDRRHPHTVIHEAMVSGRFGSGTAQLSLAAGKGFVAFGTDDPMVRPFTKYPANHHLSQVMERVQVIGAVRIARRVALEATVFHGDEPSGPLAPPRWRRFGDSRATRLTVWPVPTLELQGSLADVRSPEFIRADGLDHRKHSASVRWTPGRGRTTYLHAEWARTDERVRDRTVIVYGTALAEMLWSARGWNVAARAERTSRPEEERLLDPFRTARPPNHLTLQGMTRWQIGTLHVNHALPLPRGRQAALFGEVSRARSTPLMRPVLLDPRNISGADVAWHVTGGLRFGFGSMSARAGRYGVAAGAPASQPMLGMTHPSHAHGH